VERIEIKELGGINVNVPCGMSLEPRRLFNLDLDKVGGYSPYGDIASSSYYQDFMRAIAKDNHGIVTWETRTPGTVCIKKYDRDPYCKNYDDRTGFSHIPGAGFLRIERVEDASGTTYARSEEQFAGVGTDDNSIGGLPWTDPGNITSGDGAVASASMFLGYGGYARLYTNYLTADTFGFSIPSNAVIRGIEVIAYIAGTRGALDNDIRLTKDNGSGTKIIATSNHSRGFWHPWKDVGTEVWGGPNDLWGVQWQPAEINNDLFGAKISAHLEDWYYIYAKVDAVVIKVYYNTPGEDVSRVAISGVVIGDSGNIYDTDTATTSAAGGTSPIAITGQRHDILNIETSGTGSFSANPVFGIVSWVDTKAGRVAIGLAHVEVSSTSDGIRFYLDGTQGSPDRGADIYYLVDANTGYTYAGTITTTTDLVVSSDLTGPAKQFMVFENSGPVGISHARMFMAAHSVGVQRTEGKFYIFDFTKLKCIGVFDPGMHMVNEAQYFLTNTELTGMAPIPGGIMLLAENESFTLTGDLATATGTRYDRYPSPIGLDPGTSPVVWGSVVFSIWHGRVYAIEGGRVKDISVPVYDPQDAFVSIAHDPPSNDLYAVTSSGKVYVYDPERSAWMNGLMDDVIDAFPSPIGVFLLPSDGTYSAKQIAFNATSVTKTPEVEWCVSPLPNQMSQFHWVYVPILNYDGVPELEYEVDGRKAKTIGSVSAGNRYRFRLNGDIGYTIRMRLSLPAAVSRTTIRPSVELHVIPRQVVR